MAPYEWEWCDWRLEPLIEYTAPIQSRRRQLTPEPWLCPQTDVNTSLGVPEAYNAYDGASSYGDLENAQSAQYNPYVHDPSSAAAAAGPGGPTIYNQQSTYAQPVSSSLNCIREAYADSDNS